MQLNGRNIVWAAQQVKKRTPTVVTVEPSKNANCGLSFHEINVLLNIFLEFSALSLKTNGKFVDRPRKTLLNVKYVTVFHVVSSEISAYQSAKKMNNQNLTGCSCVTGISLPRDV